MCFSKQMEHLNQCRISAVIEVKDLRVFFHTEARWHFKENRAEGESQGAHRKLLRVVTEILLVHAI